MKIAINTDTHIQRHPNAMEAAGQIARQVVDLDPDLFLVLGDMGGGAGYRADPAYAELLGKFHKTYWVLGNHDLWCEPPERLAPPQAMKAALARFRRGTPLETSWSDDHDTVVLQDDHALVGSMGFADFADPTIGYPEEYFRRQPFTCDGEYLDVSQGWDFYACQINEAFGRRLAKAFASEASTILVATHYAILPGQAKRIGLGWTFFYDYGMGRIVLEQAARHPEKRVFCFCGHSHEYCWGKLVQEAENVWGYGVQAEYKRSNLLLFDTDQQQSTAIG